MIIMSPSFLVLALSTVLCILNGVKGPTGFTRLPSRGGIDCPDTIQFKCVSTGTGRTLLRIGSERPFDFSHSEYREGASINESRLGQSITAGNLSRSPGMECLNMTDYCYTMFVVVHLTEQTSCRVINCTTILLDGSGIPIGSFTASRSTFPSTPMNLRILSQSESSVTFGWDPGSPTCNMNYSVSIQNCGTCDHDPYISRTNVTCADLEPGQQMQCSVTVRSISECGNFSAPLTRLFELLAPETETEAEAILNEAGTAEDNVGAIVGGVVGGVIGGLLIIAVTIVIIVLLVVCFVLKMKRDQQRNHPLPVRYHAPQGSIDIPESNGQEAVHGPQPSAQSQANQSIIERDNVDSNESDPLLSPRPPPQSGRGDPVEGGPVSANQSVNEGDNVDSNESDPLLSPRPPPQSGRGDPVEEGPVTAGVDGAGIDIQPPGPEDHQIESDLETLTNRPASSGGATNANGPGEQQLLERNVQLEDAMIPEGGSASAAGAKATGTDNQEIFKASDNSGGSSMVIAVPRPCTGTQHSAATRTGLGSSVGYFSEQMEIGGESTLRLSPPSKHSHDAPKEVYASSNGGGDTKDVDMPASLSGNILYIAGNRQFKDGVEVSGLKALVEEQISTKFTEQEKHVNQILTDFKTDLKEEQKKEMDAKILTLTTEIAKLTAKVEELTEKLGNKETEIKNLKEENKTLLEENERLKTELANVMEELKKKIEELKQLKSTIGAE